MKAIEIGLEVHENRTQKIMTSRLNEWLEEASARLQPPSFRGHLIKIKYITQLPIFYPAFVLFCNHPREVPENYRRYLENSLRDKFNFTGVPISLFFRDK
jgi:GTPase